MQTDLQYLVTGTGRCGTVYLSRLLTSVGIPTGHESIFDWRGLEDAKRRLFCKDKICLSYCSITRRDINSNWHPLSKWMRDPNKIVAESSYMAAPFLESNILEGTKIIHLVRNPIKVINSFCNYVDYFQEDKPTNLYEKFIWEYVPELSEIESQYDRAAWFYVRWNQMIDSACVDLFHRIEDGPEPVLEFVGKSGDYFDDRDINTLKRHGSPHFTFEQLESEEIKKSLTEVADRYGYHISTSKLI